MWKSAGDCFYVALQVPGKLKSLALLLLARIATTCVPLCMRCCVELAGS